MELFGHLVSPSTTNYQILRGNLCSEFHIKTLLHKDMRMLVSLFTYVFGHYYIIYFG